MASVVRFTELQRNLNSPKSDDVPQLETRLSRRRVSSVLEEMRCLRVGRVSVWLSIAKRTFPVVESAIFLLWVTRDHNLPTSEFVSSINLPWD
jgi:hypothetical protein